MLKLIFTLLGVCYLGTLIGCGQIGRLYLPKDAPVESIQVEPTDVNKA